jgi:hypothetical protein
MVTLSCLDLSLVSSATDGMSAPKSRVTDDQSDTFNHGIVVDPKPGSKVQRAALRPPRMRVTRRRLRFKDFPLGIK